YLPSARPCARPSRASPCLSRPGRPLAAARSSPNPETPAPQRKPLTPARRPLASRGATFGRGRPRCEARGDPSHTPAREREKTEVPPPMIVVMKMGATDTEIEGVEARIKELGFTPHLSRGKERTIIGVVGDDRRVADKGMFESLAGVAECIRILKPFKLASRDFVAARTIVDVGDPGHTAPVGGHEVVVIAGPCAVENREQLEEVALAAKACGAKLLRGGAFKPRTSPYSFQGLGEEGLKLLADAREETGLPIVTEVMTPEAVPL